jgi:putative Ig domain-containing protein
LQILTRRIESSGIYNLKIVKDGYLEGIMTNLLFGPKTEFVTTQRMLYIASLGLAFVLVSGCGSFFPAQPDFSMSAHPDSQTVPMGTTAVYSLKFDPPAAADTVKVTVSGLPAGMHLTLGRDIQIVGGSLFLNIAPDNTAPLGTSQFTVTATDASGSQSAKLSLTVTPAGP